LIRRDISGRIICRWWSCERMADNGLPTEEKRR
jgi:hypothetical protein